MPTMYEIYDNHSYEYDELVSYEDYKKNLPSTLNELFNFSGKTILEFGTGTGRVTKYFAEKAEKVFCYDRSRHMLDNARINLSDFNDKIRYNICDNNQIGTVRERGDFVIEGWSFGHTVSDHSESVNAIVDDLVGNTAALFKHGGTIILIETLGTDTEKPEAPNEILKSFYTRLEDFHGFSRVEISTDYKFTTVDEAVRIAGFFFGPESGISIKKKGSPIIKEFTGLWYKTI